MKIVCVHKNFNPGCGVANPLPQPGELSRHNMVYLNVWVVPTMIYMTHITNLLDERDKLPIILGCYVVALDGPRHYWSTHVAQLGVWNADLVDSDGVKLGIIP